MSEEKNWVACTKPTVGDVLKWEEPLWAEPNKPRGKRDKIGEQQIVAQVVSIGDFMEFKVLNVTKLSSGDAPVKVKEEDIIRRKSTSLQKGNCHKHVG